QLYDIGARAAFPSQPSPYGMTSQGQTNLPQQVQPQLVSETISSIKCIYIGQNDLTGYAGVIDGQTAGASACSDPQNYVKALAYGILGGTNLNSYK
uniref:Nodulin (Fragments) n=1 Tax=Striga hermonthica TaxID=68872 RepID=NODX_STRHE|nr:RecName: Full=Nodulin [Striga hermonthica]